MLQAPYIGTILYCDGQGLSRRSFEDESGSRWIEDDTSQYLDTLGCTNCGREVSYTVTNLDGGESYCESCMEKENIEIHCEGHQHV